MRKIPSIEMWVVSGLVATIKPDTQEAEIIRTRRAVAKTALTHDLKMTSIRSAMGRH